MASDAGNLVAMIGARLATRFDLRSPRSLHTMQHLRIKIAFSQTHWRPHAFIRRSTSSEFIGSM
ncbi:hypothetical protein ACLMJK_009174 [Lecanora helva]